MLFPFISVYVSEHCSFIQSFFAFLILFMMFLFSYCLCASSLVVLVFFSSRLWLQSFNTSSGTHGCRLIFGLPRTSLAMSRIAVPTELTRLLIFGSKKLSAANRPPIVALKCVAMFGSCSFSMSNLILVFPILLQPQIYCHHYKILITSYISAGKSSCFRLVDVDLNR